MNNIAHSRMLWYEGERSNLYNQKYTYDEIIMRRLKLFKTASYSYIINTRDEK